MEIKKISEKYNFYKEGADYILDLGSIKRAEDRITEILITGVENVNLLSVLPKCGCTASEKKIIDINTLSVKLNYKDCDPTFTKIVELKYSNVKIGLIKIKGKCS